MEIEAIARVCHEANRAYCLGIGDTSQTHWEDAPDWQVTSAINGVRNALSGGTPADSHESWLAEKQADGWVYGEVKDPTSKTHPCMVAYADLPDEQKLKDHLFVSIVRTLGAQ